MILNLRYFFGICITFITSETQLYPLKILQTKNSRVFLIRKIPLALTGQAIDGIEAFIKKRLRDLQKKKWDFCLSYLRFNNYYRRFLEEIPIPAEFNGSDDLPDREKNTARRNWKWLKMEEYDFLSYLERKAKKDIDRAIQGNLKSTSD